MFKNQIHDMDAWVEERLSDYLDGALSPQERAMVEAHLQTSERARASLESLRWTVSLLKQTPVPSLPRQFTLPVTPRAPARSAPGWMVWALRGVAVAATAAFVILLVGTLLRQPLAENAALMQQAAPAEPSVMVALAPTNAPPEQPPAPSAAQDNVATTNNTPTPIMITVEAPLTNALPQAQPTARAAQAPVQAPPQPTQASQSQKAAPATPTHRSGNGQPTPPPAAFELSPTNSAADASSAAGAAPEIATASATATEEVMTQRTFGAEGIDGVITAERLRVRAGPGAQYRTIAILKRDDHVLIVGKSEIPGWLAIQVEQDDVFIEGWITARFVEPGGPVDNLPIHLPPKFETPESAPPTLPVTDTPEPTLFGETPSAEETPNTPTATPEG